ncbi:MAG: hypothetical protein EXS08_02095 [Planctomycetes bacterium]|nr:hypothetical protein [Planctomycetota bacterium]
MPLSELTELVAELDGANLDIPAEAGALVRRMEQIGALLERVGAASSAAQLALAANLLARSSRLSGEGEEVRRTARTLVSAVERAFHLGPAPTENARARAAAPEAERGSRRPTAHTQLRLSVARDMLLGEMLVHFGVVAQAELELALELQRGTQKRLGEILVEHGFTTQAELELALDHQKRIRGVARATPPAQAPARSAEAPPASSAARSPSAPLPSVEKQPARLRMATELLLGEILVLQGAITRKELEQALLQQRKSGQLLGETLLKSGRVSRQQIHSALTMQGSSRRSRTRQAG